ncbi:N-terminal acetyltransferase A, auxiliary subunit [Suhomyces tanzawaensis NRRL Y-17324]|uniref:N-terminal acetyltransferase A, auxiliary subunit n=1 Tax=Suhomyces tanzawaensis NRRL Y-17324 TaxID=984487 RepID=A0A1E4SQE6_9ASCO|nr:N-terminal acetyltransferase A, auxiliary subunit [Suhomyces tanzawaensis NRRL Y-17324]ODV81632.1 N-terminal acetyltransferase A, auxiliary subunit [Suhomyces tanzawaensis NRRL Y-17324]
MVVKKAAPIFANKEDSNFREALKLYDAKQYKKALKLVETNLKKNANHAESLALKGCANYQLGHKDEAEPYILKAVGKGPDNYLVNHLAGIYYRSVENYPEAAKWLKAANDNGSPNKPILRDLSFMQTQIRDYKNLKDSRQQFLEHQPGYRANWTAVAIAHHLNKDYASAVSTLTKIEGIIKDHLTDADAYEQSECVLYKNSIIAEAGDYAQALKVLDEDEDQIRDQLSFLEYKAKYLMLLGSKKEASLIYRTLLKRNPDNMHYYNLLEASLETLDKPIEFRLKLYERLASFYPRSDPPKFLPLTFVPASSPLFEAKAREYIIPQLTKGVPATFVNVKPLYKDQKKLKVIESIVVDFYNKEASESSNPTIKLWTTYFLAQHYLYLNNLTKASEHIDAALKHSPTLVELYIIKARILKHEGKILEASEVMDQGRKLDLQDRFINSKTTKYLLRANKVNEAIDCISLFTKLDEDAVNGCKDLHVMQCNWVLVESAEAYSRMYKDFEVKLEELRKAGPAEGEEESFKELENDLIENIEIYKGLSLKRFQAVVKIFKIFFNDQYDFHSYCMRRGTPRDYVETLKWEDKIHATPIYTRVLKGLSEFYFDIHESLATKKTEEEPVVIKKNNKKLKKLQAQATKKRAELISKVESEKEDADPLGAKLLQDLTNDKDIIERLFELFKPLIQEGSGLILTWETLYRIYLIQGKYVLALQAIKSLNKILNPYGSENKFKTIGKKVVELSETSKNDDNANAAIVKVIEKGLISAFPDFENGNILEVYTQ